MTHIAPGFDDQQLALRAAGVALPPTVRHIDAD